MQYRIVEGSNKEEISAEVNEYLDKGWELQGGLSVAFVPHESGSLWYIQAMVF